MTPTLALTRDNISSSLPRYAEVMQRSMRETLLRAAKGVTRRVISITPPANAAAGLGSLTSASEAYRAGRIRIAHQMSFLLAPVKLKGRKTITQVYGRKLKHPVTYKTKELWPDVAALFRSHTRIASSGFGVRIKTTRKFYVSSTKFKALLTQKQARVGILASGWAAAATTTGVPLSNWVGRHGPARGTVRMNLLSTTMSFTARNFAPGLPSAVRSELARRIPYAMAYQAAAMQREIDYMVHKHAVEHAITTRNFNALVPAGMNGA